MNKKIVLFGTTLTILVFLLNALTISVVSKDNNIYGPVFNLSFNSNQISYNNQHTVDNHNVDLVTNGINNDSAYFNGNSYLEIQNYSPFLSQKGTVSVWIKTNSSGVVFSLGNKQDGHYYFMLFIERGQLVFYYFINQNLGTIWRSTNPGINLMDNTWHQVTWQSSGNIWRGFIDGKEVSLYQDRQSNDGSWFGDFNQSTNNLCIGVLNRPQIFGFFKGYMDEFDVFNQVLTPSEINNLYLTRNKYTYSDSNLNIVPMAKFSFNVNFNYVYSDNQNIINHGVQEKLNSNESVGYFNGYSYLEVTRENFLQSYIGTVSAWVKTTTGGTILSLGNSYNNNNYFMLSVNNNSITFYYWNNNASNQAGTILQGSIPGKSLLDNQWHQLVWQSNGSSWTGYIDGSTVTLKPMKTLDGTNRGSNDGTWFGSFNGKINTVSIGVLKRPSMYGYFTGYIRDVQVFNTIMTPSEINSFAYTINPPDTGYSQFSTSTNFGNYNIVNSFLSSYWISIGLAALIIVVPIITLAYKRSVINQDKKLKRNQYPNKSDNQLSITSSPIAFNLCIKCHSPIDIGDKYCPNCGTPIVHVE